MSNSPSGSRRSKLNTVPILMNADDGPESGESTTVIYSSGRSKRRSDSKGRTSRSDSKGRKTSHKRRYLDAKSMSPRNSTTSPKQGKMRVSPKMILQPPKSPSGQIRSTVSTVSTSARSAELLYENDEDAKVKAKASRGSKVPSKPGMEAVASLAQSRGMISSSNHSTSVVCGDDEIAKGRARAARGSNRYPKPDMESVAPSVHSRSTTDTPDSTEALHGDEEIAKARARAARGLICSPKPRLESVASSGQSRSIAKTQDSTAVLYGDDEIAKARARAIRGSNRYPKPGVEVLSPSGRSMTTISSAQSTALLYGMSDRDTIAKAKASSSHYKKRSSDTHTSPTDILYGNDADAKSKAGLSRLSRSHNPGVEHVVIENDAESSRSSRSMGAPELFIVSERSAFSRSTRVEPLLGDESETSVSSRSANSPAFVAEGELFLNGKHSALKKRKSPPQKKTSYSRLIILAFVAVLIGGGVTAFIALRQDDNEQGAQQTEDARITEPPKAPPTAPPSDKQERDPPSAEDCAAIRSNQTSVPGNNSTSNWNVNIQINVKGETGFTDEMLQELMDSIQELLLPSMAGCTPDQRKLIDVGSPSIIQRDSRALHFTSNESRFAILFASVNGEVQDDAMCVNSTTPDLCYVVLVELTVYLDSEIGSAEFTDIIWEELEDGSNIVSKLELGD
ncbi:MAG: hypothetical protein SGBAC_009614, partial [Bacillariaceae sp.]